MTNQEIQKKAFDLARYADGNKKSDMLAYFLSVVPYSKLKEFIREYENK